VRLALELGTEDNCIFLGYLNRNDIRKYMSSSVATVVPSISEAFGLVNIESMAMGTPVVASATGGIKEIIRDDIDGFLVAPGDAGALAQKLGILANNPSLREEMAKNARERFLSCFEQKTLVSRQVEWFEQLVETRHGGRLPSRIDDVNNMRITNR
jgi:glycosyltransferase involved in cell wall biosynthesis